MATELGATTKAVALGLSVYGRRDGGNCRPGEDTLAHGLSLSGRSVRSHLETLSGAGFIDLVAKGYGNRYGSRCDTYQLTVPHDLLSRLRPGAKVRLPQEIREWLEPPF
ncbi:MULTISPECIES: hypothetical protein [unclassified Nocardiopsis]|uniref:hypothetical protein n=1 Tax=unclassified Nocardiopsis TaxID=2649073 RepID=UPI00135B6181|nr:MULTISPECIES: hypothetical protein [unclassified Nocardiopsis]